MAWGIGGGKRLLGGPCSRANVPLPEERGAVAAAFRPQTGQVCLAEPPPSLGQRFPWSATTEAYRGWTPPRRRSSIPERICLWKEEYDVTWPLRVLVVENDVAVGETLVAFLEDKAFDVRLARTGEDALALLREGWIPQAGVVDMGLPGMDGRAVVECARVLVPDMRFVVHTRSSGGVAEELALSLGIDAQDVFVHPVQDLDMLAERLRRGRGDQGP